MLSLAAQGSYFPAGGPPGLYQERQVAQKRLAAQPELALSVYQNLSAPHWSITTPYPVANCGRP